MASEEFEMGRPLRGSPETAPESREARSLAAAFNHKWLRVQGGHINGFGLFVPDRANPKAWERG